MLRRFSRLVGIYGVGKWHLQYYLYIWRLPQGDPSIVYYSIFTRGFFNCESFYIVNNFTLGKGVGESLGVVLVCGFSNLFFRVLLFDLFWKVWPLVGSVYVQSPPNFFGWISCTLALGDNVIRDLLHAQFFSLSCILISWVMKSKLATEVLVLFDLVSDFPKLPHPIWMRSLSQVPVSWLFLDISRSITSSSFVELSDTNGHVSPLDPKGQGYGLNLAPLTFEYSTSV